MLIGVRSALLCPKLGLQVYDPVGGETFEQSLRCTAWGARVLVVGFASGIQPIVKANYALIKGLTIMGCRAGESVRRNPALAGPRRSTLLAWAELGLVTPNVRQKLKTSKNVPRFSRYVTPARAMRHAPT